MKKIFFFIIFLIVLPFYAHSYELFWYVGAAFLKPSKEIVKLFQSKNKNTKIILISGGSQILFQKILLSKKGDIYLPGAKYFEDISRKKNIVLIAKDFVNQVPVFGISKKSETKIQKLSDLCKKDIRIALGNEKTMALGKLYLKIEQKFPSYLSKCILSNCIIKGSNVAQIVNYLKMNIVDVGILFKSVANVFNFKILEIPQKYLVIDKAPLILLKFSKNKKIAKRFFSFILEKKIIFEKYGYQTCF